MSQRKPYVAYARGICAPNPGVGGWGYVLLEGDREVFSDSGYGGADTTNQCMELEAIGQALQGVPAGAPVIIKSASEYAVNVLTRKWKRRKNKDLLTRIDAIAVLHGAAFEWVRGTFWNERADELARQGRGLAVDYEEPRLSVLMGEAI